jgi:TolB protein
MWSPDGMMVAFTRQGSLYVVGADGSGLRRLFPSTPWVNGFAWSPDGRRIAATRDYPAPEIAVVDADGTGEATLVPDVSAADISWSPDGKKIVYQTPTASRLAVADIATGASRVLQTGPGNAYSPDWQPLR